MSQPFDLVAKWYKRINPIICGVYLAYKIKDDILPEKAVMKLGISDINVPAVVIAHIREWASIHGLYKPEKLNIVITKNSSSFSMGSTYLPYGAYLCLSSSLLIDNDKKLINQTVGGKFNFCNKPLSFIPVSLSEAIINPSHEEEQELVRMLKDRLIAKYPDEILFSAGHELAHIINSHILSSFIPPILMLSLNYYLIFGLSLSAWPFLAKILMLIGCNGLSYYISELISAFISKVLERSSDDFAAALDSKMVGYGQSFFQRRILLNKLIRERCKEAAHIYDVDGAEINQNTHPSSVARLKNLKSTLD